MLEHILVVEDDELLRESLEMELKLAGYRVTLAENGRQAIELARNEAFDLVVCDIRMPGINGLETLSSLREIQPSARNIVMTGYADADAPVQAVKLKVDDYLLKPFSADQFLEAVKKALTVQLQELRRQRGARQLRRLLLENGRCLSSGDTASVCQRAATRAVRLGRRLGLSMARLETLQLACFLYPLREQLSEVEDLKNLQMLLEQAQELWEGGGPHGLQGSQIPLDARILRLSLGMTEGCDPELPALLEEEAVPLTAPQSSQGLLSLARSYVDGGQWELAMTAVRNVLEDSLDGETAARAWLLAGRLHQQLGEVEFSVAAARRAGEEARKVGLERVRSEALLLEASQVEDVSALDLPGAARLFAAFEDAEALSECYLLLNDGTALLEKIAPESDLWLRYPKRMAKTLAPLVQEKVLQLAVQAAADRSLQVLQIWLEPSSSLELRLKALDLLALLVTPSSQALLSGMHQHQDKALAQKSKLLSQTSQPERPRLEVYLFGRMRLGLGGLLLTDDGLSAKKTRGLLAFLAWTRGRETSEEILMDMFWPDSGSKARHSLHNAIYQIRKAFKTLLGDLGEAQLKLEHGYCLEPTPELWVDSQEFLTASHSAAVAFQNADSHVAVAELKKAEALYRGEFLHGMYEDWVENARLQLQERMAALLSSLGRHFFEVGRYEVSLDYFKRLLERDNCQEDAYFGCMLCSLALQRPGEAVRFYHQCAQNLRKELNLGAPPRLVELYLKVQSGETVDLALG